MSVLTDDLAVFVAKRDETVAALDLATSELPAARAAVEKLKSDALAAARKFNQISARVLAAVRPDGVTAPVLIRIVDEARQARDAIEGDLSLATQILANLEWKVSCLVADRDQLARVIDPPRPGRVEIVRRQVPGPAFVEQIEFRNGRPGEAA